jgi:hypothetical protein
MMLADPINPLPRSQAQYGGSIGGLTENQLQYRIPYTYGGKHSREKTFVDQ